VALLEQDQVPLIDNLPALVARAHQICGELDGGASVYTVVNEEMNGIFEENPAYHLESARVHRTAIRFIAVSAEVYCPSHLADPYVSDDVGFSILGPVAGYVTRRRRDSLWGKRIPVTHVRHALLRNMCLICNLMLLTFAEIPRRLFT
jgi:hypothetical protein